MAHGSYRILTYLQDLTLACPVIGDAPPDRLTGTVPLALGESGQRLKILALPAPGSFLAAAISAPATVSRLWKAIRRSTVVHYGVVGWPIPLGWIAAMIGRIVHRQTIIIIESAPWREQQGMSLGFSRRIKCAIYEHMARWCLRHADLRIFTSQKYRDSLIDDSQPGYVIDATWISADSVLSDEAARDRWQRKSAAMPGGFRGLFAGRLEEEKAWPCCCGRPACWPRAI